MPYGNYNSNIRLSVGDVNNDGYDEIVTASSGSSAIKAWSYKGQNSVPIISNNFTLDSKEFVVGRF